MQIAGIEIESKADAVALIALVLSLVGLAIQLTHYLIGSQLTLFVPEQVIFKKNKSPDDIELVNIIARMTYINEGADKYNEIVLKEAVTITLESNEYNYLALNYLSPQRKESDLIFKEIRDALPFIVEGKGVISHHTQFVPTSETDVILWSKLRDLTEKNSSIIFTFCVKTNKDAEFKKCQKCKINSSELKNKLEKGWSAMKCIMVVH